MTAFAVGRLTEPRRRSANPGSSHVWRILGVAAPLLATVVTLAVAWGAHHPSFPFDEIDQLQMSRMLAGADLPQVTGAGYYPLWSFLLAPIWWVTSDPFAAYTAVIAIGMFVGLAAIWPLARIASRFRLTAPQSVVAASIAVTMPSVTIQTDYALSERLLLLLVALAVLTAWRLWETPTHLRAVVFALVLGAMYFTHVRVLAVVLASAIWLILFMLRNWRVALVGLIVLAVAVATADWVGRELNIMLLGEFAQGENLLDTLRESRPGVLLRSALGQAWTQVVGTFGLAVVGAVALARWSWTELRRLRTGRATYVLAIVIAAYLLTTIKWASDYHLFTRPWRRIDTWLYGRYVDPLTVILVVVALAVIVRGIRRWAVAWSLLVSLFVILPTVYWVSLDAPLWAYRTPAHIPGVMPWWWLLPENDVGGRMVPALWNEGRFWLVASLATVVALFLVYLLRRFAIASAAIFAIAFAGASLVADQASNEFHEREGAPPAAVELLRQAAAQTPDTTVMFDMGCSGNGSRDALALNYFGYWFLPTIVDTFRGPEGTPDADIVITCLGAGGADVSDARFVPDSVFLNWGIWVRDGQIEAAFDGSERRE